MCNCAVAEAANPVDALALTQLRVAEMRVARAVLRRRKTLATQKAGNELARELRRLYRREAERVIELLRGVKLPYVPRTTAKEQVFTPDDLARLVLNGVDYVPYEAALSELYRDIAPLAMDDMIRNAIGASGKLMSFSRAQAWVKANKIIFGERWAKSVTSTTNEAIRNQLAAGWRNFESTDQLIARVQGVYDIATRQRAEVIARTESSRAYNNATLDMGREIGASRKFWISSGSPYAAVDVCSENADRGEIAMNDTFLDIEGMPIDAPPAHPNCLCDIGYEFADDWQLPADLFEGERTI